MNSIKMRADGFILEFLQNVRYYCDPHSPWPGSDLAFLRATNNLSFKKANILHVKD